MVAAVDALSREALGEALKLALSSASAVTTVRSIEALGPLRAMILPMPVPMDFLTSWGSRVSLTDEDKQALSTIELLLDMMGGEGAVQRARADPRNALAAVGDTLHNGRRVLQGAGELLPIMPELLPGVQVRGGRVMVKRCHAQSRPGARLLARVLPNRTKAAC